MSCVLRLEMPHMLAGMAEHMISKLRLYMMHRHLLRFMTRPLYFLCALLIATCSADMLLETLSFSARG